MKPLGHAVCLIPFDKSKTAHKFGQDRLVRILGLRRLVVVMVHDCLILAQTKNGESRKFTTTVAPCTH